jgi:hypothetical protein
MSRQSLYVVILQGPTHYRLDVLSPESPINRALGELLRDLAPALR